MTRKNDKWVIRNRKKRAYVTGPNSLSKQFSKTYTFKTYAEALALCTADEEPVRIQ